MALALALLGVGGYAVDASGRDQVADGVRVGGVGLGGLSEDEAIERVREQVAQPLTRPIRVEANGKTATLSARRLGLKLDVRGIVDRAIEESRDGGVPGRLWRRVTGGEVARDIPVRVTYSKAALSSFVGEQADRHNVAPRNAEVVPSGTRLGTRPSRNGRVLKERKLGRAIAAELAAPAGDRYVRAEFDVARADVTTAELAKTTPYFITVDRPSFRLRFWKNLRLAKTYTIAIGAAGYDTPAGLYNIQNKAVNPTWNVPDREWAGELAGRVIPPGPDNPLKARWMGIYDGAGIHGTEAIGSLGTRASRGCIRMAIPDVKELYEQVPVQTPVYIA